MSVQVCLRALSTVQNQAIDLLNSQCYDPCVRHSGETSEKILDIAQFLVQTQGFNGFSYADIAAQLKIRNAAVHYHFPIKADLGRALAVRYRKTFALALSGIDARVTDSSKAIRKLELYANLFQVALDDGLRMCLCGMLASELVTLPDLVQLEVRAFFSDQQAWLTKVLDQGRKADALLFAGRPSAKAEELLAGLEGAMLLARTSGSASSFRGLARGFIAALEGPSIKN
jgi:TetR/AcrR family transcriptional regulator, transcriptional repressor for nem operon